MTLRQKIFLRRHRSMLRKRHSLQPGSCELVVLPTLA